jgi:peptide/nickel transport system permease protein
MTDIRNIKARRSFGENVWRTFKSAPPSAVFGMVIIFIYAACAIFAPWIAPYGEREVLGKAFLPVSWTNLFPLE